MSGEFGTAPERGRRLIGLYRYPVKSCRGTALESALVGPRGIVGDREYMLVDASGRFLTQRELPAMALIVPGLHDGVLEVSAPGMPPLTVQPGGAASRATAVIWDDSCEVIDRGDVAAAWFTRYLRVACRLVQWAPDVVRRVDPERAPPDSQVGFADGYPFLLAVQASLDELNARMPAPLPMNRFRPNVVVDGRAPFEEDMWLSLRIGGITFTVVKPCARCPITTVDQATAQVAKEPLRTLATFRRVAGEGVMFGQNLVHDSVGELRVGAPVDVDLI